ncbi:hypothetical protein RvY_08262 [Ramazzottius varieornatus]|uniref:Uncharacterized protein n=1 Tax=Ramazzottius varieornatus TaxID=947166 RepID=A0A1D1V7K7_RAMVA|nr:hypothetical protein RvY_08262 [Ramazzottius varieornatus]
MGERFPSKDRSVCIATKAMDPHVRCREMALSSCFRWEERIRPSTSGHAQSLSRQEQPLRLRSSCLALILLRCIEVLRTTPRYSEVHAHARTHRQSTHPAVAQRSHRTLPGHGKHRAPASQLCRSGLYSPGQPRSHKLLKVHNDSKLQE